MKLKNKSIKKEQKKTQTNLDEFKFSINPMLMDEVKKKNQLRTKNKEISQVNLC
jgi:hypothetical protein